MFSLNWHAMAEEPVSVSEQIIIFNCIPPLNANLLIKPMKNDYLQMLYFLYLMYDFH